MRGTAQVEPFGDNAGEARLRWLGCAQRRCSGYIQQRILNFELSGGRKKGSSQQRFTDIVKKDVQRVVETEEDARGESEEDEDEVEGKRRRVDKEVYGALLKPPRYCFADVCI